MQRSCVGRSPRLGVALSVLLLLAAPSALRAQQPDPFGVRLDEFGEPEEPQSIREQLTEREDENRVEEPWSTQLFGRPLTLSGEAEQQLDFARRTALVEEPGDSRELLLVTEVEAEVFHFLGGDAYLFLQGTAGWERLAHAPDDALELQSAYLERGEMWVVLRNLAGRRLHLELGSLDFEDDRTSWWDEDLDAIRLEWETQAVDVALAFARELAPRRSDLDGIEPAQERVWRILGEATWDWAETHALELFVLRQGDRSPTQREGDVVRMEREDEWDADLLWAGPRAMGAFETPAAGVLGYWADLMGVLGHETALAYEELEAHRSVVEERRRRRVRGWAVDTGVTWLLPFPLAPRLTLALAMGSGDGAPEGGTDTAFRQTGIQGNEVAFGGVERFTRYGLLLDPELSNLRVWTLGFGVALLRSSSLDLVLHDYRLVEPGSGLRDARLDLEVDGRHGHLGTGADVVLALEDWGRFQATLIGSAFRAGEAVRSGTKRWSYGGFVSLRLAF